MAKGRGQAFLIVHVIINHLLVAQNGEAYEKRPISVGPWGGQEGERWDDGAYTAVRQVVITHGAGIDAIQFEYDLKGTSLWSQKHGGNGGKTTDKIKLNVPDEYLISISGHYGSINSWGPTFVRSLMFQSNKRSYGPYGVQQGTHFTFSMDGGKIVGFHGKAGWFIDSIGLHLKSTREPNPSKALVSTQSFVATGTDRSGFNVVQGSVGKGYDIVVAVRQKDDFEKVSSNDISRQSSTSSEEDTNDKQLSFPAYSMKESPSFEEGSTAVSYGPWGGGGGSVFDDGVYTGVRQINLTRTTAITSIKVLYDRKGKGIWGNKIGGTGALKSDKRGWFIDAIGVHVLEGKVSTPTPPTLRSASIDLTGLPISEMDNPQWSNKLVLAKPGPNEEVSYGVVKEPAPCGPGPWGGDGGRPWDDGVFTGVKQIYVTRGDAITSIQIEYDRSGQSVWSVRHGGSGTATNKIKFDFPNEVVICISGYYGNVNKDSHVKAIKSLTFHTSRGKYGPFGEETGTFFTSTTTEGKIVGFHGRSSMYLDAIGVHMQHWLGNDRRGRSVFNKFFA
ncbi:hypothetical protein Syun_015617 [Stephania yunnanensis]|uniref:Jacalin-type lectin domain-containing protein n=1 Tax=Stephania yunnanensis TaxID=152371 RepID=A0AAP0JLP4_9MAGN